MPRKHLIASGINKKQQQQAKTWMKCAKEIKAAAKVGGTNPEANPRLKAAIERALQNNLSRDSIQRNINGANKDADNLKELTYEGYGPNGLAIIIRALTDNEQRTISNLRGYFSKLHGQISKPNSVMMLFDELGQIILDSSISEEQILEATLDYEIISFSQDESATEIRTSKEDFFNVKKTLEELGYKIIDADIKYLANSFVNLSADDDAKLEKFIDTCNDDDDVQWVVTNLGEILD